ncbi:MAG: hypothetical protein ACXW27_15120 [Allosphingosinicella sp.]
MKRNLVAWALAGLFVVSVGWFALLYYRGVAKDSLDMEFAKALLNVGVVSVAATLLSLLTFQHRHEIEKEQREREDRAARDREDQQLRENRLQFRDELLKSTLGRVTATYNRTKRARREMRALGRLHTAGGGVLLRLARYDACMAEVNDAQLELEEIKSDIKTSKPAYTAADQIASSIREMERYLGALIEEYESVRAKTAPFDDTISSTKVPRFKDFLGPVAGSGFEKRYSDEHSSVRASIRGDLIHLNFSGVSADGPRI